MTKSTDGRMTATEARAFAAGQQCGKTNVVMETVFWRAIDSVDWKRHPVCALRLRWIRWRWRRSL